jgi:hypothetical protein
MASARTSCSIRFSGSCLTVSLAAARACHTQALTAGRDVMWMRSGGQSDEARPTGSNKSCKHNCQRRKISFRPGSPAGAAAEVRKSRSSKNTLLGMRIRTSRNY